MPPRIRALFSTLGLVFLFTSAVPLYRELTRRSDIWWTPRPMLVPLAEGKDRVEIYVRGTLLGTMLDAGQLRVVDSAGAGVLTSRDIGLRFNNWDRVRAERVPGLLVYAAGTGVTLCLVILLLSGRLIVRPEREPAAS